jgi:predicted  nucleic acid-binding Zn-ribbon protein
MPDAEPPSSASPGSDGDFIEAEPDPGALDEDTAQADARSDVVSPDELDAAASPPSVADDAARTVPPKSDDSPGIDDLRQELNDQFESIKILEPGQYELNLMELYDRQECIISLQEDGHYVIEVADTWRDDP